MLNAGEAPAIIPGEHCSKPYDCAYYAHCTRGLVLPDHPVTELPRISAGNLEQLEVCGVVEIPQLPEDFPLTPLQERVREAVTNGSEYVSDGLGDALQAIHNPVYHLDFETFMPAIPRYAGNDIAIAFTHEGCLLQIRLTE